ncbi:MAG: UDP-N-acetylmuramate dehydrogenase [Chitinophagaceae bacterium]
MHIQYNTSLKLYNTFGIDATAEKFIAIQDINDWIEILKSDTPKPIQILGGGSNILLTKPVQGTLVWNQIKGKEIVYENEDIIKLKCNSGEVWHNVVMWCVEHGYGGIENMALIPGTIGAAPIQNIGAYGVELKDVFVSLEAIDNTNGELKILSKEDCELGYRNSIFKQKEKGRYFITAVTLQLQKKPILKTTYGNIMDSIQHIPKVQLSIQDVAQAVIQIRQSKLPNPSEIGNAGSFFKNPIISESLYQTLLQQYPAMPHYKTDEGYKIPAGWLIEQAGWKGYRKEEVGVHEKQALVLVNYGHANGQAVIDLAHTIIQNIATIFSIQLEPEVNIW